MEIEVGEYVRTIDGETGKVKHIIQDMIFINSNQYYHTPDKIKKHSKNIIDLIEVGDFVNRHIVNYICDDEYEIYGDDDWITKKGIHLECGDEEGRIIIENKDIKSIAAKERFKSVEYRLGE